MSCHIISIPDTPILYPTQKSAYKKKTAKFQILPRRKPQSTPSVSAWISEYTHEVTAQPLDAVTVEHKAQTDRARQALRGNGLRTAWITRRGGGLVGGKIERDGERLLV